MTTRTKWRKVLYEDQGMPDNYVDESFLTDMKKNLYVRMYKYNTLLLDTGRITQQVNAVITFIMCFILLENNELSPYTLNVMSFSITMACYLLVKLSDKSEHLVNLQSVAVFCLASFALSPVLMTLTNTISTDTIYVMTTVMLLMHLLLHDYSHTATQIPGVVSFNAGIFATVCLASRLHTVTQAFSLIALSVQTFALWPNIRKHVREHFSSAIDVTVTIVMAVLAVTMLYKTSLALTVLLSLFMVFVSFFCPYLLLNLQPYKNNIYGPWDEAVIQK